jgi:hypothetical protein
MLQLGKYFILEYQLDLNIKEKKLERTIQVHVFAFLSFK